MNLKELYQEIILEHGKNPRNLSKTEGFNKDAKGNNPLCGDNVHVYLKLNGQKIVEDASFEGSGCAISMASASIMTDLIKGKNEHEAKEIVEDFLGMIKENPELKSKYLSEDEKTIGSICIDLGHSNTSVSIFENNNFIYGDSVLVGSNNITNDIARGVSTTIDSAERLKTLYSSLISAPSDEYEIIEVPIISGENDKFVQINRLKINSIVKPRVEETLEMIWQKLKQNNLHKKQIKNVVLTGGGSQLEGISQYAELIFSSNVRIGFPKEGLVSDQSMKNSSFADVIGCSLFDPDIYLDKIIEKQGKKQKKPGFGGFFNWLDQYI